MTDPYAGIAAPEDVDPYQGIAAPAGPPRKSQALGFARGLMRPLDNAALGVEAGLKTIGIPVDRWAQGAGMPSAADAVQSRQDALAGYRAKGVEPGIIGDVVGSGVGAVPMLFATGATGPIAGGMLSGALTTEKRDLGGVAGDMAIGAAGGKLGDTLVGAVGRNIEAATRPYIKTLREAGVKLTPGQVFGGKAALREDRLMSKPVIGGKITADRQAGLLDWNRAMVDDTLSSLGVKVPPEIQTGHDAVAFAQKAIGDAYERVVPKLSLDLDEPFMVGMQEVAHEARMLPAAGKKIVQDAIKNSGLTKGSLSGKELQGVISDFRKKAGGYSSSSTFAEREIGEVLGWVTEHLDDALIRQNPKAAPELKAVNSAFKKQLIIDDAASRADEGIFSTGQAKQAARRFDNARRKTATARGEGPMAPLIKAGRDVLPSKTPNSFSADRLMEGKLIPMLSGAAASVGYEGRRALADAAARLPPEAAAFVRRFQKPVGLFGGMAPGAARAGDRRD